MFATHRAVVDVKAERPLQGTSCDTNCDSGSPLLILPSIIIPHVKLSILGLQCGLSKAAHSENGRRMVPYYGSAAIVCYSRRSASMAVDPISVFVAGAGKTILWYAVSRPFL